METVFPYFDENIPRLLLVLALLLLLVLVVVVVLLLDLLIFEFVSVILETELQRR